MEVHETYVGWLPESKFNLALLFDTSLSELNLTSDIKVATEQEMNIDVSASLNGRLDNYKEILGCNVIFCRAAFIDIDYVLNLDEERITGRSSCGSEPCTIASMDHSFVTSDTVRVFEDLSQSGIINPFVLAYLLSSFRNGESYDGGHIINF